MVRNDQLKETGGSTKVISAYIEELRQAKGVSQKQLAEALGGKTTQSYVSIRLNGKKTWSLDDLDTLAQFFGVGTAVDLVIAAGKRSS